MRRLAAIAAALALAGCSENCVNQAEAHRPRLPHGARIGGGAVQTDAGQAGSATESTGEWDIVLSSAGCVEGGSFSPWYLSTDAGPRVDGALIADGAITADGSLPGYACSRAYSSNLNPAWAGDRYRYGVSMNGTIWYANAGIVGLPTWGQATAMHVRHIFTHEANANNSTRRVRIAQDGDQYLEITQTSANVIFLTVAGVGTYQPTYTAAHIPFVVGQSYVIDWFLQNETGTGAGVRPHMLTMINGFLYAAAEAAADFTGDIAATSIGIGTLPSGTGTFSIGYTNHWTGIDFAPAEVPAISALRMYDDCIASGLCMPLSGDGGSLGVDRPLAVNGTPDAGPGTGDGGVLYNLTSTFSGGTRTDFVVVKAQYNPSNEHDVWIKYCGCGFTATQCRTEAPNLELLLGPGNIIVYPENATDTQHCGAVGWTMPLFDGGLAHTSITKYEFDHTTNLIATLRQTYSVRRIHNVGVSNGGCWVTEQSGLIPDWIASAHTSIGCRAFGPASTMLETTRTVPLFVECGFADPTIPFADCHAQCSTARAKALGGSPGSPVDCIALDGGGPTGCAQGGTEYDAGKDDCPGGYTVDCIFTNDGGVPSGMTVCSSSQHAVRDAAVNRAITWGTSPYAGQN